MVWHCHVDSDWNMVFTKEIVVLLTLIHRTYVVQVIHVASLKWYNKWIHLKVQNDLLPCITEEHIRILNININYSK